MWNSAITRRKDARREFTKKERELAEMISDNAVMVSEYGNVLHTSIEVRDMLRIRGERLTTPQVEQIAAKYRIELAQRGKLR